MSNASDVMSEVVADVPAVLKLLGEAVDLYKMWKDGSAEEKAAAESQAQAKLGTMNDERNRTEAAHAERVKETEAAIEAREHPVAIEPPKLANE